MKIKRDKSGMFRVCDKDGRLKKKDGNPVDQGGYRSKLDAKLHVQQLEQKEQ